MVFDDNLVTVPFMREGKIIPKWLDLVQKRLQEIKPDSIKLNNTWFTPYLKDNPSEVLYEVQTKMSTFSMHDLIWVHRKVLSQFYQPNFKKSHWNSQRHYSVFVWCRGPIKFKILRSFRISTFGLLLLIFGILPKIQISIFTSQKNSQIFEKYFDRGLSKSGQNKNISDIHQNC